MGRALFLLLLAAIASVAEGAQACTPRPPTFVVFAPQSAQLPRDSADALRALAHPVHAQPAKCSAFELLGYPEPGENGELVVTRMEAIKRFLTAQGAAEERVSIRIDRAPIASVGGDPYQRAVTVSWSWAPGQWRCDPASDNPNFNSAACQTRYSRCYLVLADGTICNPQRVPNPNPETYSVAN